MPHQGHKRARFADINRWRSERGGLLWDRGPSMVGRSFEEDLALFERQVREEAGEGTGSTAALVPAATPSA
jgi:hypothetical protein